MSKENNRRYYLHSRVRKHNPSVRVSARDNMMYVDANHNEFDKYIIALQQEFDYGIQKEIR